MIHAKHKPLSLLSALCGVILSLLIGACNQENDTPEVLSAWTVTNGPDGSQRASAQFDVLMGGQAYPVSSQVELQYARGDADQVLINLSDNLLAIQVEAVEELALIRLNTPSGTLELEGGIDDQTVTYAGNTYYSDAELEVALRDDTALNSLTSSLQVGVLYSADIADIVASTPGLAGSRAPVIRWIKKKIKQIFSGSWSVGAQCRFGNGYIDDCDPSVSF